MSRKNAPSRKSPLAQIDYTPTPPYATRALLPFLSKVGRIGSSVWDPAAGRGHILWAITGTTWISRTYASDLNKICLPMVKNIKTRQDFTMAYDTPDGKFVQYLITNPPFNLWTEFAETGIRLLEADKVGEVWLFGRANLLEGRGRYQRLFSQGFLRQVVFFVHRVPMGTGIVGNKSSMIAFAWFRFGKASEERPTIDFITASYAANSEKDDDELKVRCTSCKGLYEPAVSDGTICNKCKKDLPF